MSNKDYVVLRLFNIIFILLFIIVALLIVIIFK